jgi:HSP20 family protein
MLSRESPRDNRDNRWPAVLFGLRDVQDDLNRVFTSALRLRPQPTFLAVSMWVGSEGAVVRAFVPGVSPDRLNVSVEGQTLTLAGERDRETIEGESMQLRTERMHGRFARTLLLPFRVDPDQAKARLSLGVLMIELPRPEADRPRRIQIAATTGQKSKSAAEKSKMKLEAVADPRTDSEGDASPSLAPPTDIHETQNGIVMFLDIPGADPESVNVRMQDRLLSIVARSTLTPPAGYSLAHSEQPNGNYAREFSLSEDIEEEHIAAVLKDGVLRLNLPKAEQSSIKQIPVNLE